MRVGPDGLPVGAAMGHRLGHPREHGRVHATAEDATDAAHARDGTVVAAVPEPDRRNLFDALRLLAAALVLVSHSFVLTGRTDPFGDVSGATLGELGVTIFFAMSGYLIAQSWTRDPDAVAFAGKRALRLLPGLIVASAVTAFVIGPLFSGRSPGAYFTALAPYAYVAKNAVLYTVGGHLPGVFSGTPYPDAVNGSLWTLPVEAAAYAMAAVLGLAGALRRAPLLAAWVLVLLVAGSPPVDVTGHLFHPQAGSVTGDLNIVVYLVTVFAAGSLRWSARDRVALRPLVAVLALGLWIALWKTEWERTAAAILLPYVVLTLAVRAPGPLQNLTAPGDVSYGLYVYAFPVQQAAASLGASTPLALTAAALPVTYALALASWRFVERPALGLKRRLRSGGPP